MPLAAHGVALARATFRIKQHPAAAACRACTLAGIVLGQSPLDIVSPADIGQVAIVREGAENIDVAVHASSSCVESKPVIGNCCTSQPEQPVARLQASHCCS